MQEPGADCWTLLKGHAPILNASVTFYASSLCYKLEVQSFREGGAGCIMGNVGTCVFLKLYLHKG